MHESSVYVPWSLALSIAFLLLLRRSEWRVGLPFLVLALFSVILACGPIFAVFGDPIIRNVAFDVARLLPAFPSVPARFGILASAFLLCGAIMIGRFNQKILFVVMLIAGVEIFPKPLRVLDIASTPVLDRLAMSPLTRLVDADGISNLTLGAQMFHGRSIVGGFLSRRPRKVESDYRRNPLLAALWRNKSSTPSSIWDGMMTLGADGVLVRRALTQQSGLMSRLPCFRLADEDPSFQLFVPDNGALCAD